MKMAAEALAVGLEAQQGACEVVTPVLSRVLNPSGVSFGKGQVPVSGLVPE